MREGEEFAGTPAGGAKVGQFFGLGSRVVCGEDNGAAVADATAVDMVLPTSEKKKRPGLAVVTCGETVYLREMGPRRVSRLNKQRIYSRC
jgi:hypothetical protein